MHSIRKPGSFWIQRSFIFTAFVDVLYKVAYTTCMKLLNNMELGMACAALYWIAQSFIDASSVKNYQLWIALLIIVRFNPVTHYALLPSKRLVHHAYTAIGMLMIVAAFWSIAHNPSNTPWISLLVHCFALVLMWASFGSDRNRYRTGAETFERDWKVLGWLCLVGMLWTLASNSQNFFLILEVLALVIFLKWRFDMRYQWTRAYRKLSPEQQTDVWRWVNRSAPNDTLFKALYLYHYKHPKCSIHNSFQECSLERLLLLLLSKHEDVDPGSWKEERWVSFRILLRKHITTRDERAVWAWEMYPDDDAQAVKLLKHSNCKNKSTALPLPEL